MVKTFYIFRHGLATHSKTGYGSEVLTAGILPEAVPSIERLGTYLKDVKSDYNVRSEIPRCQQTAEIVANATNQPFVADARINEYHNETFDEMKERVQAFLTELQAKPYETVMICSHGMIIAALSNFITKGEFSKANETDFPPPAGLFIISDGEIEKITLDVEQTA